MTILTRYLLRLHVAPFAFAVTGLTLLLLLDQVSRRFGDLIGKDLHWTVIVEVFVYSIPFILAQTLPMAVLIAVLYTFNRLAGDFEITAIRASGVPLARVMVPLVVAATIVAGGMTWFNNTVLPESNHKLQVLLTSIGRKKPTFSLRERTINEVLPSRLYVQPGVIDRGRSSMEDVAIYDERGGKSRTIYADSGRMAFGPEGENLYLTLLDGSLQERPEGKPTSFQRIRFRNMVMKVEGVANALERDTLSTYRSDREMNIQDMYAIVVENEARVARARNESRAYALALVKRLSDYREPLENAGGTDPGAVDSDTTGEAGGETSPGGDAAGAGAGPRGPRLAPDRRAGGVRAPAEEDAGTEIVDPLAKPQPPSDDSLMALGAAAAERFSSAVDASNQFDIYRQRENDGHAQISKFWVEIHKKGSIPAACIVFVLIGAPIAVRYPRAGVALVVGVSLVFFGAYYVSLVGGEELADRRIVSPLWAMWAPNVLFGLIGLGLMVQARRVTG
ncbi:MAG: LptF/LptG family permease [Gemmatimonadota bacterium]|nr:LptF/LptG family permease [Gemmatimonadota bacterium]